MRICILMIVLLGVTLTTGCDIKREYKGSQDISQSPPCPTGVQRRFSEQDSRPVVLRVDPAACDAANADTAELARDEFCQLKGGDACDERDCQPSLPLRLCKGDFLAGESANVTVANCKPIGALLPSGRIRCGCTVMLLAGGRLGCGCRCRE